MSKVVKANSTALPVKRRSDERIAEPDAKVRRLSAETGEFALIDEHVKNTPNSVTQTVSSLADYLASGASSDLEKVRAIYIWVTDNIKYDREGFRGAKPLQPCDSVSVLKNRVCVCEGYAMLVRNLCREMSIECKRIYGFSKGVSYNPLKPLDLEKGCDHVWNVVKLYGTWRFIEATWGAGRIKGCGSMVKDSTEFYFLTDPDYFIEDHFPYKKNDAEFCMKWQLLENPIDLDTFHKRAYRTPPCIQYKIELVSHDQAVIENDEDEIVIKLRGAGNPLTNLTAELRSPTENIKSCRYIAPIIDHCSNEATIIVRPPASSADYLQLNLYGNTIRSNFWEMLVSYRIRANKSQPETSIFPDIDSHYGILIEEDRLPYTDLLMDFAAKNDIWIKVEGGCHELVIPLAKPMDAEVTLRFGDEEKLVKNACVVEVRRTSLRVCMRLRQVGFYALELFSRIDEPNESNDLEDKNYVPVACFLIECLEACDPDVLAFPDIGDFCGAVRDPLKYGFTKEFRDQEFILQAEGGELELMLPTLQAVVFELDFESAEGEKFQRFCLAENLEGFLRICLRMPKVGFYDLTMFCQEVDSTTQTLIMMANFIIECTEPLEDASPFPQILIYAMKNQVTLECPRDGNLPANSEVRFKLNSPHVAELLVNKNRHKKKDGDQFDFTVKTGAAGRQLGIFGAIKTEAKTYEQLYTFQVV